MQKIITTLVSIVFLVILNANNSNAQSIQWIRDAGSTPFSANENGTAIASDENENAYVLGHLSIDSYFSGVFVPAHEDGCLAKYNSMGNLQWVKTFGGPGFVDIQETSIKVSTVDNAIYVCGSFRTQFANPTITFDTISYSYFGNSRHGFLAKYDLNGNIQWMKHGGGQGLGVGFNDIDIDDHGRIVVVATVSGTNFFDAQTLTFDGGILLRYLPDGTQIDLIQLNDISAIHQEAREVEVAPGTGNIYIGGAFFDSITLNGFTANSSAFNIFEIKLDSNLICRWLTTGGGSNSTFINGLALDASENSYMTGVASGDSVKFGTQIFNGYTTTDNEIITLKTNSSGTPIWLRHGGSIKNDFALDIVTDEIGNSIITGYLGGNTASASFDTIQVLIFTQSAHCFLARYDVFGNIIYARVMGGGSDDTGSGLAIANDSTFYFTGTAQSSAPWDTIQYIPCCLNPNLVIAKFSDEFNSFSSGINEIKISGFSLFPNPFQSEINLEFNLSSSSNISFIITDLTGRIVKIISTQLFHQGKNNVTINLEELNKGFYFCHLLSKGEMNTTKMLK